MSVSLFNPLVESELQCPIFVNGVEYQVPDQMSVAGALLYLGQLSTRRHPVSDEPRASYCHMGVCFECLVTINGLHKQRACLHQVAPNMRIETLTEGVN